jgi:flavin-dependent dehydrogenase
LDLDLDLAIVGGGPAGIATALFLAAAAPRLRDRLAVFEKERYPREKICAGAVGRRADRLLAEIGVRVDVPSAEVRGLSVVTPRGEVAVTESAVIGRVVRRVEMDHAFAEIARARGIRVLEGAAVSGVAIDGSGARLDTAIGEVRTRAVVGADGVGSFVRRALGFPRGAWQAQVVECDTPATGADRGRELLHFDLTDRTLLGYAWDFPTIVGGEPLVCRGLYELRLAPFAHDDAPSPDLADRLLARLDRQGAPRPARIKRFAERGLGFAEPLARPRALLVGEAAGIDPALGEGIAQAIFYGALAGPYLARCLERDDLSFADFPRLFARSRVGLDLRGRALLTPLVYGRARAVAERWLGTTRDLALVGARYFAGEHVPRGCLARAALAFGEAALREQITSRWAPWW